MSSPRLISIIVSLLLGLGGCGGGSNGNLPGPPPPPPPPAITKAEAFQFLNQASFGATEAEAQRVIEMGFEAWIDNQMAQRASLNLPFLQSLPIVQPMGQMNADRADIWFRNALHGSDQLRQRVAFALSEIFVVSQVGALNGRVYSTTSYYDLLVENAFGNYRDLIEKVTLHPAMGVYLSMLSNERPDPVNNIRPDENYARELMQLFSIGLIELNQDGTPKLDAQNQPVPTYDQEVIQGFAHVYTGWTYANATRFRNPQRSLRGDVEPMVLWPEFHDNGPKKVLTGVTIPAGQTGDQDLAAALNNIFNHDNVGPFIAIRLIHRLVTSNPSPGYVSRVAGVFNDNGRGVRGDLAAVVKAILLDDEARPDMPIEIDGKIKEPLLRLTQLWRAYDATSQSGRYPLNFINIIFGQGPLQAPHVFNFFSPFFAPPGEIRNNSFVAPELEISTEYLNTYVTNFMFYQAFAANSLSTDLEADDVYINFEQDMLVASDVDLLIDTVAGKLLAGEISDTLRNEIAGMLAIIPATEPALRVAETIYLITTSPEYAYQR